ncbi:endonuclease/exonuclease/phosphatase superfamily [Holotrichia oblita]|uniref:Endonuclease/exonuclease/phosphatase superfamily n=1 Tax=Holotrichia oblita TaxID=644536 RepID=A0ACB9SSD3_HOLOL|nr:endonuclease/exonuclease/phosphatase superfamily [Holotrichia oblita]
MRKKGKGEKLTNEGHLLIHSGVNMDQRAHGGVGCLIRKDFVQYVKAWKCVNERMMTIDLELQDKEKTKIIVVYGPNEDDRVDVKNDFWEMLCEETEDYENRIYVLGDFNARVGQRDGQSQNVVGACGEAIKSNNGQRLIEYCIENELIITNTFYFTRLRQSREEKSIIDYVLTNQNHRKELLDVRVYRGSEIGSDHRLLKAKIRMWVRNAHESKENISKSKNEKIVTKTYKLRNKETAEYFRQKVEGKVKSYITKK